MVDTSRILSDPRVAETAGRYIIPVVPLHQETAVPPEQMAKVTILSTLSETHYVSPSDVTDELVMPKYRWKVLGNNSEFGKQFTFQ